MIGCLTLPFRLLGLLLAVLLVAGAWLYRDRIVDGLGRLGGSDAPSAAAESSPAALRTAREKVAGLDRAGTDSVVLDAAEAASLMRAGLDPMIREQLDSFTVELGSGRLAVSALVETGRLPSDLVGPLSIALRDRERVTIGGTLAVAERERAIWTIDRFEVRRFPLPRDLVPGLVDRALGREAGGAVTVRIPREVRAVRVEPQHVILYSDLRP